MAERCFKTSLKVSRCKRGAIPLRAKCYAGVKVKEKLGTESKRLRLGINKVNSRSSFTGAGAEFHSWRSANTIAKFHLRKGEKTPPSWRNVDWFPAFDRTVHVTPPVQAISLGRESSTRENVMATMTIAASGHCFEPQQLTTRLVFIRAIYWVQCAG